MLTLAFILITYFNLNFMIKLNNQQLIEQVEKPFLKKNLPKIKIGDSLKVGVKIKEGNKERTQFYEGTIIAKKNSSISLAITVRKALQNTGVERILLLHSPKVDSVIVLKTSKIRRSKLYYLRNLNGKAGRLRQKF